MEKENRYSYNNVYNKQNYTCISVRLSKTKQADIIEYIRKQPSSAAYIAQLVREDMARHNHDNNVN